MFASRYRVLLFALLVWPLFSVGEAVDEPAYQPCPLFRAYYPPPTLDKSSEAIKSFSYDITATFDNLVRTGKDDVYGTITPNATSFSVVLFSGVDDGTGDPVFYSYHHTALAARTVLNVTLDSIFPVGTLTQLFTVYAWLVKMGDQRWDDPITRYLPELISIWPLAGELAVPWGDVTIGTLASHMAGIGRDSNACELGKQYDRQDFINSFAQIPALFLPDTTPILSNAAFQLLAFALTSGQGNSFGGTLHRTVLQPLNMTQSGLFREQQDNIKIFGEGLNASASGEQAALSFLSTTRDLARAGSAMLSSRLLTSATTRRWLHPTSSTSNLRNSIGRPWEIYHAGGSATAPILDIFLKAGEIGSYSSYLGLSPDINAGFAILAHDASGKAADLNVYADVVADALEDLVALAAEEGAGRFAGVYSGGGGNVVEVKVSRDGPGFVVARLWLGGRDVRAETAAANGIALEDLDFRVYPSARFDGGKGKGELHQFVGVVQDMSAPVDAGTPTCVTWMTAGSLGAEGVNRFVFGLDEKGTAVSVTVAARGVSYKLTRNDP